MFERFTAPARAVVQGAQDEARRRHDGWVGTEHLLVALLLDAPDSVVLTDRGVDVTDVRRRIDRHVRGELDGDALATIGIDLDEVRRTAEAQFGAGALEPSARAASPGRLRFTRRAKKVLELSLREAVRMHHDRIASGHILLGLLREGQGLAVQILVEIGVDPRELQTDVEALLGDRAA